MRYETVIGLEVHAELATESKIFCACSAHSFGSEPNANICPACCGMPGVLPIMNKRVLECGIKAGLMCGCEIARVTTFDRKNYFYPDLPSGYQLTQWFAPIATRGCVEIETSSGTKRIRIKQIHMEEDAGKLVHDISDRYSYADFNRTSVPLIEIVSMPDISSADEAEAYLERLKTLLRFARVSECEMAHGTMRCDVNVSIREEGSDAPGVRTEMKNLNSIRSIRRAIEFEAARHADAIANGTERLERETRRWDDEKGMSFAMRAKETAGDYGYFPDANIMPITVDDALIERLRRELPEMPEAKKARYMSSFGLSEYDASRLTESIALCECFEKAREVCGDAKAAANWTISETLRILNARKMTGDMLKIDGAGLGEIVRLVEDGKISRANGRRLLEEMFDDPTLSPAKRVAEEGCAIKADDGQIEAAAREAIAANRKAVDDYLGGKEKALMALFGQCMKRLKGNCDPLRLRETLVGLLAKGEKK